jgi:hypothetical protein
LNCPSAPSWCELSKIISIYWYEIASLVGFPSSVAKVVELIKRFGFINVDNDGILDLVVSLI